MKPRILLGLIFGVTLAVSGVTVARAQVTRPATVAPQETDDEVKVNTYKRFVENREPYPAVAYQAARDYMGRYGKEDDQYTRYLKQWIAAYEEDERTRRLEGEREDREQKLLQLITQRNFVEAYGQARTTVNSDPNNVKLLIALGYGAVTAGSENFNADALNYAQKAIQLIESGQAPASWSPFKNKDDVLASLHYASGFYSLKTSPDTAIGHFIKAAQADSDRKTAPSTYYYLALAYQNGPYKRLSADYSRRFANQAETPESKALLESTNKVIDHVIDAYARAIALAGNDPQQQASKVEWTKRLTELYKFRHEGTDTGLNELIASALSKPLPQP